MDLVVLMVITNAPPHPRALRKAQQQQPEGHGKARGGAGKRHIPQRLSILEERGEGRDGAKRPNLRVSRAGGG